MDDFRLTKREHPSISINAWDGKIEEGAGPRVSDVDRAKAFYSKQMDLTGDVQTGGPRGYAHRPAHPALGPAARSTRSRQVASFAALG